MLLGGIGIVLAAGGVPEITSVVRQGDPAPGAAGTIFANSYQHAVINDLGDVAWLGNVAPVGLPTRRGFYVESADGTSAIGIEQFHPVGTAAIDRVVMFGLSRGGDSFAFADLGAPVINEHGQIAFEALFAGDPLQSGIFTTAPADAGGGCDATGAAGALAAVPLALALLLIAGSALLRSRARRAPRRRRRSGAHRAVGTRPRRPPRRPRRGARPR